MDFIITMLAVRRCGLYHYHAGHTALQSITLPRLPKELLRNTLMHTMTPYVLQAVKLPRLHRHGNKLLAV